MAGAGAALLMFELYKTKTKASIGPPRKFCKKRIGREDAKMKVQVCIIGGGPSGLLLSQLLHLKGIDTLVLEKYSREHVLARIRAGVIEHGMAKLMREAQCGERMDRDGEIHNGFHIAHDGVLSHIDLNKYS